MQKERFGQKVGFDHLYIQIYTVQAYYGASPHADMRNVHCWLEEHLVGFKIYLLEIQIYLTQTKLT